MTMTPRLAMWLLIPALAWAQQESDQARPYIVSGATAAEVRRSIDQLKPADPEGNRHDAVTYWSIKWNYRSSPVRGGCSVTTMNVSLDLSLAAPRWVNEPNAPTADVLQWRRFLDALEVHENGHKAIARASAAAIRDAGLRVIQPTCADVDRVLDSVAKGLLEQCKAKQKQYDAETNHGRTQGMRFPE